jgi:predicted NUDIX family NTP pyrophosphohydrolase
MVRSCGILLYRREATGEISVFIAHLGGPFWARKDAAAWSIPKGEPLEGEADLAAALREFAEEIGAPPPPAEYAQLGEFRQASGKTVVVFAAETDFTIDIISSNTFPLEWPPRSGIIRDFPEMDAAGWFPLAEARIKVAKGQVAVLDALLKL